MEFRRQDWDRARSPLLHADFRNVLDGLKQPRLGCIRTEGSRPRIDTGDEATYGMKRGGAMAGRGHAKFVALVAIAALTAAACGGGGKSKAATPTTVGDQSTTSTSSVETTTSEAGA